MKRIFLLSETRNDTEIGKTSDDDSTIAPLISEEEMDALSLGDESDAEPMSTDMLEDIYDGSQSHLRTNRREAGYKINDILNKGKHNENNRYYQQETWV